MWPHDEMASGVKRCLWSDVPPVRAIITRDIHHRCITSPKHIRAGRKMLRRATTIRRREFPRMSALFHIYTFKWQVASEDFAQVINKDNARNCKLFPYLGFLTILGHIIEIGQPWQTVNKYDRDLISVTADRNRTITDIKVHSVGYFDPLSEILLILSLIFIFVWKSQNSQWACLMLKITLAVIIC